MKTQMFRFMTLIFVFVFANVIFAGSINTALQFDGINDFVSVADSDALSPQITGDMTISAWVKLDTLPIVGETLISKGTEYYYEYNVGVQPDGRVNFTLWRPQGSHFAYPIGGSITLGQWHNIIGVYKKGGYANLFLDGSLVASVRSFNPPITNGPGKLYFGKTDNSINHWWFKGAIDEVQIWNYAKTDAEVQQSFDAPVIGNEPGLVAYWDFNEGSGQIVKDATGHGQNGILGSSSNTDSADPLWITADGTPHVNTEPTANAGQDQCVYAGLNGMAAVTLDGSDSNDPQNDKLEYTWSYTVDGQVCEANGVKPTLNLSAGTYTISLIVNDGEFDSQVDEVMVEVVAPLKVKMKLSPVLHSPSAKLLIARFDFPKGPVGKIEPYSVALAADPNITADYINLTAYKDSILNCDVAFESASIPSGLLKSGAKVVIFGYFKNGQFFYGEDRLVRVLNRK